MKKRVLSLIMLFTIIFPLSVSFAYNYDVIESGREYIQDGITYIISDSYGEAYISDVDDNINGDLVIPNIVQGCMVTYYLPSAFKNLKNITTITLPENLERIGALPFEGSSPRAIYIPANIEEIHNDALRGYNFGDFTSISFIIPIEHIFFGGTEEQWNVLTDGQGISYFDGFTIDGKSLAETVTVHFNSTGIGNIDVTQEQQLATPSEYNVYDFDMRNITSPQTPNEGKANINKEQWTGDVFEFEAVTSTDVNEISICGDKPDDTKWHEIPYSYLKENYRLTYEDYGDRRYWTCRFGINETGYRKFMLKVNGYETDFFTYATLYENTNNASYDKEPPYEVKIMWQNVLDRNAVTLNEDDCDDDIVIQGFAYDNVGIKKVTLYYEGIEITSSYGNSVEATVQKSALHSGNNEFFVIAEDTAGNTAYSPSKYIVIDNAKPIDVTVNGNYVNFDVYPQVINGRTMIPIRAVTEALGGDVWWDESTNTAVITSYNKTEMVERTCYIQIGSDSMRWEDAGAVLNGGNSGTEWLDSPAVTIDGRTLVPIRAIAEVLGYTVEWNESTQTVSIYN